MTLGLELFGVFVAGVLFTLVFLAVAIPKLGPRLIRWQMQRTMGIRAAAVSKAKFYGSQSEEGDKAIDEAARK